jgi:hypothetical protein
MNLFLDILHHQPFPVANFPIVPWNAPFRPKSAKADRKQDLSRDP